MHRQEEVSVSGIILAGGKNLRMGTNKAFLPHRGERLIDKTVRLFGEIFAETIIVTNSPLDYLDLGVLVVTDIYPGKGALGGIYTGLFHAAGSHAFCAACDMPFLNRDFLIYMRERVDRYDVVVPVQEKGYQPLHAVYAKTCLNPIKKLMAGGNLKISALYRGRRVLTIGEEIIRSFDAAGKMFLNINTPDDLSLLT